MTEGEGWVNSCIGGKDMKMSIRKKLITVTLLLLAVPCLIVGIVGYTTAKNSLDGMGEQLLQNSTKQVLHMIDALNIEVENGNLPLEEAQEKVKEYMIGELKEDGTRPVSTDINLGELGYFFVIDEKGLVIAHPTIEGQDAWEFQDSNGNYFVQEFIKTANNGGGFVKYDFALPDNPDKKAPKIAYSELDPNWGWVIVPSSYMMDYNSGANSVLFVLLITLGIAIIVGVILIVLFSNHLSKPIQSLAEQAKQLADGNLAIEPLKNNNNDEIGTLTDSFNQMTENFKTIIGNVFENSQHVAATSEELSASSEQTSKATEEISHAIYEIATGVDNQSKRTEEMTAIVAEISTGIEHIATNIQDVNETSQLTAETAQSGNEVVMESSRQMEKIKKSSSYMEQIIASLGDKSSQISNVIAIITNIAEQTNLLALNAAIEAARAGEDGKGFAVVADEVRKLAEESSRAGGQVDELVKDVQREVERTIAAMTENGQVIEEGITLNSKAAHAFEEITAGVNNLSQQINDISAAIEQINSSTATLLQFTNEIDSTTKNSSVHAENVAASAEEQNASMEEVAAAAEQLAKMAEQLQNIVSQFRWE